MRRHLAIKVRLICTTCHAAQRRKSSIFSLHKTTHKKIHQALSRINAGVAVDAQFLKSAAILNKGRTGSIPVPGTTAHISRETEIAWPIRNKT